MKLCIIGFGAVGQGVTKVISMKRDMLVEKYDMDITVVAVTDRSGAAINQKGLDTELLNEIKEKTNQISDYPEYGISNISGVDVLEQVDYDCLVEVTPTNINDGEPAKTHMVKALKQGKNVVTSNKGPLALCFSELIKIADSNHAQLNLCWVF